VAKVAPTRILRSRTERRLRRRVARLLALLLGLTAAGTGGYLGGDERARAPRAKSLGDSAGAGR